jgi:hypothetical protein
MCLLLGTFKENFIFFIFFLSFHFYWSICSLSYIILLSLSYFLISFHLENFINYLGLPKHAPKMRGDPSSGYYPKKHILGSNTDKKDKFYL